MKCFRSVTAGVKGKIEKVLVENGTMVEKGTTLMLIRPDK
jgi:biotin carboxyl carrier protein